MATKKQSETNALQVILKEQNVSEEQAKNLVAAFGAPFTEAGDIINELYDEKDGVLTLKKTALKVTSEDQTDDMAAAREKRLALKKIRTGVEAKRKELKEDALRAGRVIDAAARYIKQTIEPAEEYLQLQEDFVKIKQAKEEEALLAKRREQVIALGADPEAYNLAAMSDGMFNAIIEQLQAAKDKAEAEAKAAEEAAAKAAAEKEAEDKRVREENEKLKAEAEAREKAAAAERAEREAAERKAEQEKRDEYDRQMKLKVKLLEFAHGTNTVEEVDRNLQALKDYANGLPEADQVLDVVQAAYNKSKSELIELRAFIVDRDAKAAAAAQAEAEAKAKAEEEEKQRQAMLAPDKDKLVQFADAMATVRMTKLPAVQSNAAQQIVNHIQSQLQALEETIKEQANSL